MASYTCKIRIHLPLTSGLKPDTGNTGHYDIQIMKTGLTLLGKTYNNPIISYGSDGVSIYNGSEFAPRTRCMYCHAPITVTDANISNFVTNWLEKYCDGATGAGLHKVTSGAYANYSKEKYNCFGAVGEWCALMGDSFLKSIHDSNSYTGYIAWVMYKQYHTAWIFDQLNS